MKFRITNPAPKVWNVIEKSASDAIDSKWKSGYNGSEAWFCQKGYWKELESNTVASFSTRKAARSYVESIGGRGDPEWSAKHRNAQMLNTSARKRISWL